MLINICIVMIHVKIISPR